MRDTLKWHYIENEWNRARYVRRQKELKELWDYIIANPEPFLKLMRELSDPSI